MAKKKTYKDVIKLMKKRGVSVSLAVEIFKIYKLKKEIKERELAVKMKWIRENITNDI